MAQYHADLQESLQEAQDEWADSEEANAIQSWVDSMDSEELIEAAIREVQAIAVILIGDLDRGERLAQDAADLAIATNMPFIEARATEHLITIGLLRNDDAVAIAERLSRLAGAVAE